MGSVDTKSIRKRPRNQCILPSTVSDDLILLRLSSYLSGSPNGSPSPDTDSCDSFQSHGHPVGSAPPQRNGKLRSGYRKLDGIWADWGKVGTDGIGQILASAGIIEVEALNRSARAGQCQFATVAAALSIDGAQMASDEDGFRPDLELRKLVIHAISHNPERYQYFLVAAGRSTRSSSQEGGTGVNLAHYLRTMSKPSTDGDHVTLQALCDVLKITIRIVKPSTQYSSHPTSPHPYDLGSCYDSSDDCASSLSSSTPYLDPLSLPTGVFPVSDACSSSSRRIYISEEMKPRRLKVIDDRIRDVQNIVRGRLIWLSHVGDAHFRYLRPVSNPRGFLPRNDLLDISEEYKSALFLQKERIKRLSKVCLLNDGYTNILQTDSSHLFSVLPFRSCGICFSSLQGNDYARPSCCKHCFCLECLIQWSGMENSCPVCKANFLAIFGTRTNSNVEIKSKSFSYSKEDLGLYDASVSPKSVLNEPSEEEKKFICISTEEATTYPQISTCFDFSEFGKCNNLINDKIEAHYCNLFTCLRNEYEEFLASSCSTPFSQTIQILNEIKMQIDHVDVLQHMLRKNFLEKIYLLLLPYRAAKTRSIYLPFISVRKLIWDILTSCSSFVTSGMLRQNCGLPKLILCYANSARESCETRPILKKILYQWCSLLHKKESHICSRKIAFDKDIPVPECDESLEADTDKCKPKFKAKSVKVQKIKYLSPNYELPQVYSSVARAPGKRKVRPVIPSNVTRLDWGSRTYS